MLQSYWREGVYGLSVNEACRRAKVSKPALYREFGGEDGLMDAVLEHYLATVFPSVVDLLSGPGSFADALSALVNLMTEKRSTPAGCLLVKLCAAPARLGPLTRARIAAFLERRRELYRGWIVSAQDSGQINTAISVDLAVAYLETQVTTLLTQVANGEDPEMVRSQAALAFAALTCMTEAPLLGSQGTPR
ncbi:MAG: TetR/AcrR family transcriptional regulator [Myxococcota bacterium]